MDEPNRQTLDEMEWSPLEGDLQPVSLTPEAASALGLDLSQIQEEAVAVVFAANTVRAIDAHLSADMLREHGGVLFGVPCTCQGRFVVLVTDAGSGASTEGTPVHLRFTADTWVQLWSREDGPPGERLVGWYHSHPGMGVFMSGTDRLTQRHHFALPWQIALVVDPIRRVWGVFYGCEAKRVDLWMKREVDGAELAGLVSQPATAAPPETPAVGGDSPEA